MTAPAPLRVVVDLDPAARAGRVVVSAVVSLFGPADPVEVAFTLAGVEQPGEEHATLLADLIGVGRRAGLPDVVLLDRAEAAGPALLRVTAGADDDENARSIVLLTACAQQLWAAPTQPAPSQPAQPAPPADLRAPLRARWADRDARTGLADQPRPVVVVVLQHQSYWGAVADVCAALARRDDVRLELVAVESEHDLRSGSTAQFLEAQGYRPRSAGWLADRVARRDSAVALVLLTDPYDDLRPTAVRSDVLAEQGVRTAYLPYASNNGAGAQSTAMQYDLPLHRTAWRAFVRSDAQKRIWAGACRTGADHVRVVGLPKLDRALRAPAARDDDGRPVFLWNPHFTVGAGGFSTFDRYLEALLTHFLEHDDRRLLVRPHFRLFRDAALAGGTAARWEPALRAAAAACDRVAVDDDADYLPAFGVATALISDASSLVTEFLPTGKPLLYLHRPDGPGLNEDAEHFLGCEVATSWPEVLRFLDEVTEGVDHGRSRRRLVLDRHFAGADGRSAGRVVDLLLTDLRAELTVLPAREVVAAVG